MTLHRGGEVLHITPQVLIEFRSVATRPTSVNGLGLSTVDAEVQAAGFETAFPMLQETPDIYPAWKTIVDSLGVIGKQVHDACLVAVCHVHSVTHVLTFNVSDFVRNGWYRPGHCSGTSTERLSVGVNFGELRLRQYPSH
jgi:hypothetical protein